MKVSTTRTYEKIDIQVDEETATALRMIAAREGISIAQLSSDVIHSMLIDEAERHDKQG